MNSSRPNHPKIKLERFIKQTRIQPQHYENYAIGEDLLSLIFSYVRKIEGLHLRWNKQESASLLYLTINQLAAKKNNDPLLQKAYDLLIGATGLVGPEAKDLVLEMADRIINKTTSKNRAISRIRRKRKEHIFKKFVRDAIEDHPLKNHIDIRQIAIKEARNKNIIYEVDEEAKKIIFEEHMQAPDVAFPTIRGWISDIKSKS